LLRALRARFGPAEAGPDCLLTDGVHLIGYPAEGARLDGRQRARMVTPYAAGTQAARSPIPRRK